jgi:hypothetical protein
MTQSRAEAEALMEQQHYGGDYISPQDAGLADPDEEKYCLWCNNYYTEDTCPYCDGDEEGQFGVGA